MHPLMTLPQPPWHSHNDLKKVLTALNPSPGCTRLVGGCVRDALLEEPIADIDLATTYPPQDVLRLLENTSIKAIPYAIEHGTVLAIANNTPFQVTTLREDLKTNGRHAEVAYTPVWEADARRRDFTLNALYADFDGTIYDPCQGYDDLKNRRVHFIGAPAQRIQEDYLRILRYFRFQGRFAPTEYDQAALEACQQLQQGLKQLSNQRVWEELSKLLRLHDPGYMWALLSKTGILTTLFQEGLTPYNESTWRNLRQIEQTLMLSPSPWRRLCLWLPLHPQAHMGIANRLSPPRAFQQAMRHYIRYSPALDWQDPWMIAHPHVEFDFWVLKAARDTLTDEKIALLHRLQAAAVFLHTHPCPVDGEDLLAAGLTKAAIGIALTKLKAQWAFSEGTLTKEQCLQRLKKP